MAISMPYPSLRLRIQRLLACNVVAVMVAFSPLNTTDPRSPSRLYARLTAVWSRLADDRRTRLVF
jgi:hypothetical protein